MSRTPVSDKKTDSTDIIQVPVKKTPLVIPAMNCLWFWFDDDIKALNGTAEDCMRKYRTLEDAGVAENGVEIAITPDRIVGRQPFDRDFIRQYATHPFKCVHITHEDIDFLELPEMPGHLDRLRAVLEDLETGKIVLHAHHLKENRKARRDLLIKHLPETVVQLENNGFDCQWGSRPENLEAVFTDCPEFTLCLDVAHIWDFEDLTLEGFLSRPLLKTRITEIHWSYSTNRLTEDPYSLKGYSGYAPFHALFSLIDKSPDEQVKDLISGYPVVIEGAVPREDTTLEYIKKEIQFVRQKG